VTKEITDCATFFFASLKELGPLMVNSMPWLRHLPYFSRLYKGFEKTIVVRDYHHF
jgi:hypothetical protein